MRRFGEAAEQPQSMPQQSDAEHSVNQPQQHAQLPLQRSQRQFPPVVEDRPRHQESSPPYRQTNFSNLAWFLDFRLACLDACICKQAGLRDRACDLVEPAAPPQRKWQHR